MRSTVKRSESDSEKAQDSLVSRKEREAVEMAEEYKELLQRLQAEFENYKKREERERARDGLRVKAEVLLGLLPVLDSFGLALKNFQSPERFHKGVELVYAQLMDVLRSAGLRRIEAQGTLDPRMHEVLLTRESSEEEGRILEVVQDGYALGEMIIRHAKVVVARPSAQEDTHGENNRN
ncbi:MAG: nucleotide exchange factor GrpE [Nitrosarchaeum sp.]|nr:nucleotide exchange factor GrpE [Nitrosarchaeum sp.]